jgi:thymidylate synthase
MANALWILCGRDDLEFIDFYNKRGKIFSDDGEKLYGAYGSRLFSGCTIDQLNDGIIARLKKDAFSRRTVATVFQPRDTTSHSKDIPCLLNVQFLFDCKQLNMITTMRSQSACGVMPYDLFALTFLHEAVALACGMKMGFYQHNCGSFHYYEEEEPFVETILKEPARPDKENVKVPTMPHNFFTTLLSAMEIEQDMRQRRWSSFDRMEEYWRNVLAILGAQTYGVDRMRPYLGMYYFHALK